MAFTSAQFLVLVLGTLIVYYSVPGKFQWCVLLAANYIFYLSGGVSLGGYLVFITLLTYGAGLLLCHLNGKKGEWDKKKLKSRKKLVTGLTLGLCFALLFALKYFDGAMLTLNTAFSAELPILGLAAPLGISYYIFQSCGYVIDCHRGKYPVERNLAKYALYVSFFPQMVQGPISRHRELAPQLTSPRRPSAEGMRDGCQLVLWGLLKKLVIADRAGVVVNTVLGDYPSYAGSVIAFAVLFYCIQLYCDFSGGIDVARGVAALFGVELPDNFRRPLFATSVADYWRRWHITLGGWMRDYVFYPISLSKPFASIGKFSRKHLGGVFGKILPTSLATFLVYLFIGIWHGSDPKYIVFGFWNGIIITASLLLEPFFEALCGKLHINRGGISWRIVRTVRTALIIFAGRYLTRALTLKDAVKMLSLTLTTFSLAPFADGTLMDLGVTLTDYIVVAIAMLCVLTVEFLQERGMEVRKSLAKQNWLVQYLAILIPTAAVLILGLWIKGEIATGFIYMQF